MHARTAAQASYYGNPNMSDDSEQSDEWDFYPCRVDDGPASIFLNLRYEQETPSSADRLYWLVIYMLDGDEHAMGSRAEAEALFPLEDEIIGAAESLGLVYVGRLRNQGKWQLTFYGGGDQDEALETLARDANLGGRVVETGSQPDHEWSYYHEFLLPDSERRQWMSDRRLVEVLEEHGDRHSTPRRVDHWSYFGSAAARDAFIEDAKREGFAVESAPDDADRPEPFGAQLFRTDVVDLEHIHDVVMKLSDLAIAHGGDYDGWETLVEKPPSN